MSSDWERLAERSQLSETDVAEITQQLDEIDSESDVGPWTRHALQLISEQPGIVSSVLARQMNFERYTFRDLVSKLKKLGLTYGLDVGYSISPRGRAYLRTQTG